MWILPSRSRPHNLQRLVTAWENTNASTPLELLLDLDDPFLDHYDRIEMPDNWSVVVSERRALSELYNDSFIRNHEEPWYGFIGDDVVPHGNKWDFTLVEAAGLENMAVPKGGHDNDGTPHFVIGGELARSVGWLSLPGLDRLYIDTAWHDIAMARGVLKRVDGVELEHRHFSNGKAFYDKTYHKLNKARDKSIYDDWRNVNGYLP